MDTQIVLNPISSNKPEGDFIHYTPDWDIMKEYRREDDHNVSYDIWEAPLKKAEWSELLTKCIEVLEHQTKDLQVVGWFVESLIFTRGLDGFFEGMHFLEEFLRTFWSIFYPKPDDPEYRISVIEWVDRAMGERLVFVPLNDFEGRQISVNDWRYAQFNQKIIAKGESPAATMIDLDECKRAIEASSLEYIEKYRNSMKSVEGKLKELSSFLDSQLGQDAPSFQQTRSVIQDILQIYALKSQEATIQQEIAHKEEEIVEDAAPALQEENVKKLHDRDDVYEAMKELLGYLKTMDPHGLPPLLIDIALSLQDKTLDAIVKEIKANPDGRYDIFKLFTPA